LGATQDLLFAGDPLGIGTKTAFLTLEHLCSFLVTLQLPVKPRKRNFAESTAIGVVMRAP
jgi:hypothetical protein